MIEIFLLFIFLKKILLSSIPVNNITSPKILIHFQDSIWISVFCIVDYIAVFEFQKKMFWNKIKNFLTFRGMLQFWILL